MPPQTSAFPQMRHETLFDELSFWLGFHPGLHWGSSRRCPRPPSRLGRGHPSTYTPISALIIPLMTFASESPTFVLVAPLFWGGMGVLPPNYFCRAAHAVVTYVLAWAVSIIYTQIDVIVYFKNTKFTYIISGDICNLHNPPQL